MAAAATEAVYLVVDDLDCDIFDFDYIQALDFDLSSASADDEFHGSTACYYSAIFSDADIVSHCRHGCDAGDGDSGSVAAACRWLLAGLVGDAGDGDSGSVAAACRWLLAGLVGDAACSVVDGAEEEEARSSSPADSGVTDDGSLQAAAAGAAAEAMSAYVAELERFLLDDDDDAPCGEQAEDLLGVVDDYFDLVAISGS